MVHLWDVAKDHVQVEMMLKMPMPYSFPPKFSVDVKQGTNE